MFKAGDKVRLIRTDGLTATYGLTQNKVYTVREFRATKDGEVLLVESDTGGWHATRFELVDIDVDDLINKANEGIQALHALKTGKYAGTIERVYPDGHVRDHTECSLEMTRVQKKIIEFNIVLSSGFKHKIKVIKDSVGIGCQTFSLTELKTVLRFLLDRGGQIYLDGNTTCATRQGIRYNTEHFISWEDAGSLMKELEKIP